MSIVAFKKKSVIQYGSKRSGKPPGGIWLPQGPFGKGNSMIHLENNYGPVGFSINGPHRNVGYVGKTMHMSKMGTPFRGLYPCYTSGGRGGRYPKTEPFFNSTEANVLGDQYMYVKPSVLSTKGMLAKKYRWAYNGQYPNYWVQPNYTGNQVDSASQGLYVQNVSAANVCVTDVNDYKKYVGHIVRCGPAGCNTSTAGYKYNTMAANAPYTKFLRNSQDSSQYTLQIQRKCANPVGPLKPFPYAVNSDNCNRGETYLAPPEWYIKSNSNAVES